MSNGGGAGAVGATTAVIQAMIQAVKASGAIVNVEAASFQILLNKIRDPLVVYAEGGIFKKNHKYLTSYKGLCFYAKSSAPLQLPPFAEVVVSKNIWVPS